MLLLFGWTKVSKDWIVDEKKPCGYVRMYYLTGGHAVYESGNEFLELKKNHLYCFPSRMPYRITQDPERRVECFYAHMDIAPYVLSNVQEINLEEYPVLKRLIEALSMLAVEEEERINGALQQKLTVTVIEYLVKGHFLETIDPKIGKGILYMQECIGQPVKLEEISKYCGYHPQYFIRLFKSCIGETPYQFMIRYRMKMAMTLLLEGETVAEAAEAVGYRESKNFSRTFRQVYGVTPSDVRKYLNIVP